ncbi:hypothetical protein MRX96_055574 [Rhipicephalus microplus]
MGAAGEKLTRRLRDETAPRVTGVRSQIVKHDVMFTGSRLLQSQVMLPTRARTTLLVAGQARASVGHCGHRAGRLCRKRRRHHRYEELGHPLLATMTGNRFPKKGPSAWSRRVPVVVATARPTRCAGGVVSLLQRKRADTRTVAQAR